MREAVTHAFGNHSPIKTYTIMENLKIQYSEHVPLIDFNEFVNQQDIPGWPVQKFIDGAKGLIEDKNISQMEFYDCLYKMAMEFVGRYLARHWDGWTWAWYVEEFMTAVDVPIWRNGKIVS